MKSTGCERFPTFYHLAEHSTEGERSLIKHFVRSLSTPYELLTSLTNFVFKHGQVGNWLGQANSSFGRAVNMTSTSI